MGGGGVVFFMINIEVVLMYVIFVINFFFCVIDLKKSNIFLFLVGYGCC